MIDARSLRAASAKTKPGQAETWQSGAAGLTQLDEDAAGALLADVNIWLDDERGQLP